MPTPVAITFDNPSPSACPANIVQLVELLRTLVSGEISADFKTFVISTSTPGVDDQDKLWFKVDGAGRPLGIFKYYSGNWRRFYNGTPGELRLFSGDPAGKFDGTGKGILGSDWDGWAICNGSNGTGDLSNRFLIGANMNGEDGIAPFASTTWRTGITGGATTLGGSKDVTLDASTGYYPGRPQIKVWRWAADGNTGRTGGGNLYGSSSDPGQSVNLQDAADGNEEPDAFFILPPYYSCAIVCFIGYA